MRSVLIVGCGYLGLRLGRRWLEGDAKVYGTAVRAASLAAIEAIGATPIALDLERASASIDVGGALVYYLVPPAPQGDTDVRLQRFLDNLSSLPEALIYMSTTGVYGDRGGACVNEDTPPAPRTARAVRRLAAEHAIESWADARDVRWRVLRVPGIYGPGRLPLERLARREPAIRHAEASPGNRVHVDDLTAACLAVGEARERVGRIYNVSDGTRDSHTMYLERVARIAGLPPPPLVSRAEAERAATPMAWSFQSESRQIDNRRMIEELGVTPRFTDLDAGIRASLRTGI